MKILIVDDDVQQNQLIIDAIEAFNIEHNKEISFDIALSKDDATAKLKSNLYDAAFIDLRLSDNDLDGEGNEIIDEVFNNLRFPIRIISGNSELLKDEYKGKNTILFQNKVRGTVEYLEVIKELQEISNTGVVNILNNKGRIQDNISNVFWNHLSAVLPEFIAYKKENPDADIEKILLRYISSHLLEYLELSIDSNLEPVHNLELYIKPPIKTKIFTGDIIKFNKSDNYGIILTPACDLATDENRLLPKAEYVTIALIESEQSILNNKNSGEIKKLKSNNADLKYHYLPPTILFNGGFINFQNLVSIKTQDLNDKDIYSVECVITNPFRKDIISRFGNYFSRQGQPVFN